jgi:DNA-binding transcriptional LysR family regulator
MTTAAQIAALRSGTIDVALVRQPPNVRDLVCTTVVREQLVVALPSSHQLAANVEITPSELRGEPLVSFSRGVNAGLHDHLREVCRNGDEEATVVQEASEFQTAICLVAAGLGVTIVPASLRRLRLPGVSYRRLRAPASRTDIMFCWSDPPESERVFALARALRR